MNNSKESIGNDNLLLNEKRPNLKHMTQTLHVNSFDHEAAHEHLHIGSISNIDISRVDLVADGLVEKDKKVDDVLFSQSEIMGLRLLFSLFDRYLLLYYLIALIIYIHRSGSCTIEYDDLVAYAEETGNH